MAIVDWRGDAVKQKKKYSVQFTASTAASDTVVCTINGKAMTVTFSGVVTVANVADAVLKAWTNGTMPTDSSVDVPGTKYPEFTRVTPAIDSSATDTITFESKDDGADFTLTVTGYAGVGTLTTAQEPSGPNVIQAENFTGGALPGASDDVHFRNSTAVIQNKLDALSAVDSVRIHSTFTGTIGRPPVSEITALTDQYYEYLTRSLELATDEVVIGEGSGDGSGRLILDLGTTACTLTAWKTAAGVDSPAYPLQVIANNAATVLNIYGTAQCDVAYWPDETSTIDKLLTAGSAAARLSERVVVDEIELLGSSVVTLESVAASADVSSIVARNRSRLVVNGANAITALTLEGTSRAHVYSSGTIATLTLGPEATFDASNLTASVTITNCAAAAGSTILDPRNLLVFTNAITVDGKTSDVVFEFGDGRSIKPG